MGTKLHCQQQLQWNAISGWEDEKSKTRHNIWNVNHEFKKWFSFKAQEIRID